MPFAGILLINTATQVTYVPNTRNEYLYMTTFLTLQSACILKHGIKTYWYLFSFSIYVVSKIHSSEPVPALTQTRLQCTFFMLCKWFVNFIAIISLTLACSSFLTTTIVFFKWVEHIRTLWNFCLTTRFVPFRSYSEKSDLVGRWYKALDKARCMSVSLTSQIHTSDVTVQWRAPLLCVRESQV